MIVSPALGELLLSHRAAEHDEIRDSGDPSRNRIIRQMGDNASSVTKLLLVVGSHPSEQQLYSIV